MKYLWLAIILILANCTVKEKVIPTVETEHILPVGDEINGTNRNEQLPEPLILDGRPYVDSRGKAYKKNEAHLISSVYCNFFSLVSGGRWHSFEGMEQLVNLEFLAIDGEGGILEKLDFTPLALLPKLENITFNSGVLLGYSLKGLEQLSNLKELELKEEGDYRTVNFTPLSSLSKLDRINFIGNITHLPDLTMLENIRSIGIGGYTDAPLESLAGIGAPNVQRIWIWSNKDIDSFAPLNNLLYLEDLYIQAPGKNEYKIADMANLPSLKKLDFFMENTKIDFRGIENMSMLKEISVWYSESFNIEGIGKLKKLERLYLNIISPEPSLEFLSDMPNLLTLGLQTNYYRKRLYNSSEAYQVLDMSPLATAKNLKRLDCCGFIIKNISALDGLEALSIWDDVGLGFINLLHSRLYDETEKSRHELRFENLSG